MARNEEKANTLFSKWSTFKKDFHADKGNRRPLLGSECDSLPDAEKFRREIVANITKKISAIRNAALGEHRIRELNDEINKLMRQKFFWEKKIRELGGNVPAGKQFYDIDGKELPGAPGYRYYGAAKELPGIRELFEESDVAQRSKSQKRTRADLYKHITPDYYGFNDEGDEGSDLVEQELRQERTLLRTVPKYIATPDSDEEYEQLAALPQIAQVRLGIVSIDNNNNDQTGASTQANILQEIGARQQVKLVEFSKQNLLSKLNF